MDQVEHKVQGAPLLTELGESEFADFLPEKRNFEEPMIRLRFGKRSGPEDGREQQMVRLR